MKQGTYTIYFEKAFNDLLKSENGAEKLNIAFQSAWNAFTYDNMDIFYIDVEKLTLITKTTSIAGFESHKVELSNGSHDSYLKDDFNSSLEINEKIDYVDKIRKEIKKQLEGYSEFEKIKKVHDFLIENVEYDINLKASEPYSILGPLTEGKAVCEGYARSFKYILDELQIPCILISGTGTNSKGETESHAWNYVELNGKWYAIDVTWDDPVIIGNGYLTNEMKYRNFLKGSRTFNSNHLEDEYLSENSIKFEFPELSKEDY